MSSRHSDKIAIREYVNFKKRNTQGLNMSLLMCVWFFCHYCVHYYVCRYNYTHMITVNVFSFVFSFCNSVSSSFGLFIGLFLCFSFQVGDLVLIILDERHDNYVLFTVGPTLYFLHSESLTALDLKPGQLHQTLLSLALCH